MILSVLESADSALVPLMIVLGSDENRGPKSDEIVMFAGPDF